MTQIPFDIPDLLPPPQLVFPTLSEVMRDPKTPQGNDPYLDLPYVPVPKAIENVAGLQLNNLALPGDVAKLQNQANRLADERYKDATWKGLTLRNAVRDMYEAISGIPADIYQNNGRIGLKKLLTKDNRLRGLGLLFILFAIASILFITFN